MATATNNEIVESGDEVHKYTLLLLLSLFLLSISYMSVISSFLALYVSALLQLNGFVCVTTIKQITCIRACSTYVYVCSRYYLYFSLSVVKHFEDALDSVPGTSKENGRSPNIERRPQPIANPDAFQFLFPVLGKCWERSILD